MSSRFHGRYSSPKRLSNFEWRSIGQHELPEPLLFFLGPPIAIVYRHVDRSLLRLQPDLDQAADRVRPIHCGVVLLGYPFIDSFKMLLAQKAPQHFFLFAELHLLMDWSHCLRQFDDSLAISLPLFRRFARRCFS